MEYAAVEKQTARDYSFSRSKLMTSSDVMTPVNLLWSSTTGSVRRLYLSNSSATSRSDASAWQEMSGSWVRASSGVVGDASTSFDSGTMPAKVWRESTRKIVLTDSMPPS